MKMLYWTALVLAIIGSINWGLIGWNDTNLISAILGEQPTAMRSFYLLTGAAGLYLIIHSLANMSKKAHIKI